MYNDICLFVELPTTIGNSKLLLPKNQLHHPWIYNYEASVACVACVDYVCKAVMLYMYAHLQNATIKY